MANKYDFNVTQGANFKPSIIWKDANGNPVDLTGYTAKMQVRKEPADTSYLIELSTANSRISIPTPANGTIEFNISSADTLGLASGTYKYDLMMTDSGGVVTKLVYGAFTVDAGITR